MTLLSTMLCHAKWLLACQEARINIPFLLAVLHLSKFVELRYIAHPFLICMICLLRFLSPLDASLCPIAFHDGDNRRYFPHRYPVRHLLPLLEAHIVHLSSRASIVELAVEPCGGLAE